MHILAELSLSDLSDIHREQVESQEAIYGNTFAFINKYIDAIKTCTLKILLVYSRYFPVTQYKQILRSGYYNPGRTPGSLEEKFSTARNKYCASRFT